MSRTLKGSWRGRRGTDIEVIGVTKDCAMVHLAAMLKSLALVVHVDRVLRENDKIGLCELALCEATVAEVLAS